MATMTDLIYFNIQKYLNLEDTIRLSRTNKTIYDSLQSSIEKKHQKLIEFVTNEIKHFFDLEDIRRLNCRSGDKHFIKFNNNVVINLKKYPFLLAELNNTSVISPVLVKIIQNNYQTHFVGNKKMFQLMDIDNSFITSCVMCMFK